MKTLKVLSVLLTYPTPELLAAADELKSVLRREGVLKRQALDDVVRLIDVLGEGDLFDAQERYILLFDRTRSLSLPSCFITRAMSAIVVGQTSGQWVKPKNSTTALPVKSAMVRVLPL